MAFIEGVNRNQKMIFPEYIEDSISEDNPVRVIEAYVDTLNLKEMGFTKTNEYRCGAPSYNPKDLLKLYIYGYMNAVRSSRKLEKETYRNIEVMWLLRKIQPDFKTIADFRKENKSKLKKIFKDFSLLCKELELYGENLIAVDGTKIKASNSKKNNYNDKKIRRQIKYIEEKAEEYFEMLDESDREEITERKYTKEQIKEKLKELEERQKKYEEMKKRLEETEDNEISTIDRDARLMDNKNNGLDVSYNVQIAVDAKHKLITAYDVINNPTDQGNLNKMAEKSKEILNVREIELVADKGYYQADDLKECEKNGTTTYISKQIQSNATGERDFYGDKFRYEKEKDIYICPEGKVLYRIKHKTENPTRIRYRNYKACEECEYKERCTTSKKGREISRSINQDFLDIVDARTKENFDKYLQRQMIVEHPFGTIKRTMNAGYYLTRGIESVEAETALIMLSYNLKRVIKIIGVKDLIRKIRELRAIFLLYRKEIVA